MDKLEIRIISVASVMMILFLGALMYAAGEKNIDLPDCVPYSGSFSNPQVKKIDNHTYQAFVVAKMWNFEPAEITIPVNSDLDVYLTSQDVVHGFLIPQKAVNLIAVPGAITKQTIHFDTPGKYKITCHEYCGIGHESMQSEITVTE